MITRLAQNEIGAAYRHAPHLAAVTIGSLLELLENDVRRVWCRSSSTALPKR